MSNVPDPTAKSGSVTLPDQSVINRVRDLLNGLESVLNDEVIACDFELLPNSSCNGIIQSSGIGLLLSDQGEFSLITPFGHIQNIGDITDDSKWQDVFDELKKYLDEFCESAQFSDEELSRFAESGEMITGFWIISITGIPVKGRPRILEDNETLPAIKLEDEWEHLVRE